jgi:hypothetical protein
MAEPRHADTAAEPFAIDASAEHIDDADDLVAVYLAVEAGARCLVCDYPPAPQRYT